MPSEMYLLAVAVVPQPWFRPLGGGALEHLQGCTMASRGGNLEEAEFEPGDMVQNEEMGPYDPGFPEEFDQGDMGYFDLEDEVEPTALPLHHEHDDDVDPDAWPDEHQEQILDDLGDFQPATWDPYGANMSDEPGPIG